MVNLREELDILSDEIAINFASDTNAVCFSKDGSYYSESGIESPLIICLRTITIVLQMLGKYTIPGDPIK